ncbi:MAG: hypothetical protein HXX12_15035 [Geothrix sp.]|uniref:hypothetical protein n=1 Tax=Geothrix sp. TaxID=1962974 RepID=UPI0017C39457|nr:hypothetical protein [Geothrix sp.]NWJ42275.1 hypothetical protein [Geothrix sp.]WIL19758.1 MAG: hypothetical protein QOZ81_002289 [Geothrix sp.]
MKVLFRNHVACDGRNVWSLSLGHEYEVLGIEAGDFRILDDRGEPILFDPLCFEVSDSQEPEFWLSKFGDEGEQYSYPPGWGVPGFFEDWHNNVKVIRQIFSAQLSHWYPTVAHNLE